MHILNMFHIRIQFTTNRRWTHKNTGYKSSNFSLQNFQTSERSTSKMGRLILLMLLISGIGVQGTWTYS